MKKLFAVLFLAVATIVFTACSQASTATHNIKQDAENFNLYRKMTAINLRTDTVLFEIEGFFNYENEMDGDLSIVMNTAHNEFKRHVVHISEGTTFVVEQLDASQFSPYFYQIRIYAALPTPALG